MSDSDSDASSSASGPVDEARAAMLSLQLNALRLPPDAPQVHELEWHPTRPLLAAADVAGVVSFYQVRRPAPRAPLSQLQKKKQAELPYGGHKLLAQLTHHTDSARSITFHPSGAYGYSASADKSIGIIDMSTVTLSSQLHDAHDTGINKLCFYDENLLLSGDDDGFVHVWDLRADNMNAAAKMQAAAAKGGAAKAASSGKQKPGPFGSVLYPLLRYEDAADYVSDFLPVPALNRLVVTSGDGHLYVYDMRAGHVHEQVYRAHGLKDAKKIPAAGKSQAKQNRKLTPSGVLSRGGHATDTWWSMSDDVADELSGAALLKRGKKLVVAGREEGVLNIFRWDYFGAAEDHFHLSQSKNDLEGSGASIDCLLRVDDDTILTGSTDGLIRLVALHPNKLLGIMGTHEEFPIESMKMSPERKDYFEEALTHTKHKDQQQPEVKDGSSSEDEEDEEDEEEEEKEEEEVEKAEGEAEKAEESGEKEDAEDDAEGDKEEDEEKSSGSDEDASSSSDEDDDAAASVPSFTSSALTVRFLASSSHDGLIKFWNCTELFEVDPDDPVAEDSDDDDNSDAEEAAAEKVAEKSIKKGLKRKQPAAAAAAAASAGGEEDAKDSDSDAAEEGEEDEDASMSPSDADSDSDGSAKGGSSSDEDDEAAATRLIKAAAAKVKKTAGGNVFARLAPSASPAAAAPAAASSIRKKADNKPSASLPIVPQMTEHGVPNMWMLVAPPTAAAPAAAAAAAAAAPAPADPAAAAAAGPSTKRSGRKDLNADTGFFAHLPPSHPMHPSQQHKRAAKAPLQLEKDNIALRGAKKRAALQEKIALRRAKTARLEQRRADAVARGEDPEQQQLSTDEEDTRDAPKAKRQKGAAGKRAKDSDDDSSDDSDDSGAGGGKKMSAKERRAAQKLEKRKNPFFDGM